MLIAINFLFLNILKLCIDVKIWWYFIISINHIWLEF